MLSPDIFSNSMSNLSNANRHLVQSRPHTNPNIPSRVESVWDIETTRYVERLSADCRKDAEHYALKGKYYRRASNCIQLSMIILGGVTTFINGSDFITEYNRKIISSVFSCVSSILGSIYVIFSFSKKSIVNNNIGTGMKTLHNEIEKELLKPRIQKGDPYELIDFSEETREKLLKQKLK
jgi:hypothetical protein